MDEIEKIIKAAINKEIDVDVATRRILSLPSSFGIPLNDLLLSKGFFYIEKGRTWGKEIKVMITHDYVKTIMSLTDFLGIVVKHIGSITLVFRQKTFDKIMQKAIEESIKEMDNAMVLHANKIEVGK